MMPHSELHPDNPKHGDLSKWVTRPWKVGDLPLAAADTGRVALTAREAEALAFLIPMADDYPGIEDWYYRKVVPGLRDGRRLLLRIERHGQLVGLGIAKAEEDERKICTVRVAASHFGRGIGVRIF